ncbi:MAG TPA: alpha-amylase family glycosyl hydrolase [Polyangia bacterium]|nr:alpha-amylase family glycosyl hydrolase [Polyangia bacterium]
MLALSSGCSQAPEVGDWKTTGGQAGDWRDEVVYQLLVDRFADGDLNNDVSVVPGALGLYQGGDWQGVIDHLDYLKTLGVTALWISPVVRNLETDANFDGYHGYWQQDFEHVNPHFGDLAKLRELTTKAHAQGFKVILDIVTNHVAQLFYYDINGNGSPDETVYGAGCGEQAPADVQPCPGGAIITHISEYDPDFDPNGVRGYSSLGFSGPAPVRWIYDAAIDRQPTLPGAGAGQEDSRQFGFQRLDWYHKKGRITDYGIRDQVLTGDFPGGLKDLATERDDVTAALTAVFARWIQAGDFDGFRIDTLKHVDHPFWQSFAGNLRKYVSGQVTLPDPTDPHDANKTVPPLTVPKSKFFMFGESFDGDDVLNGSYTFNQEVDSTFYFSQKFNVFDNVFKNNGPTTAIQDQFNNKETDYASVPNDNGVGVAARDILVNFLDNHDVPRFLFDKPSLPALHNALAYLMTEDGVPCIYYGTEQEFDGGNDPYNRERLWDTNFDTSNATFQWIQRLIRIRKAYAPLREGALDIVWTTAHVATEEDANLVAFERSLNGHTMLMVMNTSDTQASETSSVLTGGAPMTTSFAAGTALVDILAAAGDASANLTVGANGALTVPVAPRGARILVPAGDVVALP